jgi:hypothetical protein
MPDDALGSSGLARAGATGGIGVTMLAAGAAAYFRLRPIGSLSVIACSVISLLCLMTVRYYRIALQDAKLRRGSCSRVPYDTLRAQLEDGDGTETLYQRWLYAALGRVDRFFGDGEMESASLSLWPRAFGLNTPAPLWTARAFDRCLLLAFVYPIALVFVLWALTGQQGPAEAALGMPATLTPWKRLGNLFGASSGIFLLAVAVRSKVWWHPLAAYFAVTAVVAVWGAGNVAFAVALVGAGAVGVAGAVAGANAVAVAVAFAFAVDSVGAVDAGAAGAVGIGVAAAINALHKPARDRRREGYFQAVLLLLLLAACVLAPRWLATQQSWMFFGPVLLWFGLLPLVNAPFDWFSLGLTRALLRRGLEKKSWWPYAFAAIDATAAVAVIGVLSVAMLLSVQLFDDVAAHAGGRATLDLTALLDGMRASRTT